MSRLRAIVTDIEGTTSAISFVHQVLFPYARQHLRGYLRSHAGDAKVQALIDDVEAVVGWDLSLDEAAEVLEGWIDEDRKITPLKTLQGMIWKQGYEAGALKGHVYAEVPGALRAWREAGLKLYVYSSGSVEAQKLIFGHTDFGDLTPLFSGYFDTHVGGKREAASYKAIAQRIECAPGEVLFLSDVGEELDAARAIGMHTCQLIRDDSTKPFEAHPQVGDFTAVQTG
jgi:enolase-phosphatase E1